MTTLLITGATGYLAHRLIPIAQRYGSVVGVARSARESTHHYRHISVDITDAESLQASILSAAPTAIIHAAAANPGSDETSMDAVNHGATALVAKLAAQHDIRLVVVSTDVVHNGMDAPYADNAIAEPLEGNVYGHTKWLGEQAVLSSGARAVVARTSLIYGLDQIDRGTEGFMARLQSGQPLALFDDVIRQPVWVESLAIALCELAVHQTAETGLINIAGQEPLSRAQFGMRLLTHWGVDTADQVTLCSGHGIAGLPMDLRLRLDRANRLGYTLPGVSDVLAAR